MKDIWFSGFSSRERNLAIAWLIFIFAFPILDYFDIIVLCMAFTIIPGLIFGGILTLFPVFFTALGLLHLVRLKPARSMRYFIVIFLGVVFFYVGQALSDFVAIGTIGQYILSEVQAARDGTRHPSESHGLFISNGEPRLAFYLMGGFADISKGLAYDETDMISHEIGLSKNDRDRSWQAQAVDILHCQGSARHTFGHFYLVIVSSWDC